VLRPQANGLPPSRSTIELLQYLEGAAQRTMQGQGQGEGGEGGPVMPAVPSSNSFASLMSLLKSSNSLQHLAEQAEAGGAPAPGTSELNLAALVRAASSSDMGASGSMPPPSVLPWSGGRRNSWGSLTGAPSTDDLAELTALANGLKESPSVTSLMELVRSSSAASLLDLVGQPNGSATNIAGLE